MAPYIWSRETTPNAFEKSGIKREEIYYDGYFYDVTDFTRRHPGGNIIKFYTAHGEDATQAINQFHHRSKERVETLMKLFKRRIAKSHERKSIIYDIVYQ